MVEPLPDTRLTVESDPEAYAEEIGNRLLAALRQNHPASDYEPFGVLARSGSGEIRGGLIGGTSYGWLLIKMLWVSEDIRNRGLGSRIMALAEETAHQQGCHGAWLDTSSDWARKFYERLGYNAFGILENVEGERPQGHSRFFLCKRLAAPSRPHMK
jgi:predicted N-acetyltransferase YhbS